jgi:hypothetical protein
VNPLIKIAEEDKDKLFYNGLITHLFDYLPKMDPKLA